MDTNYELKASELQKRLFRDIRFESVNFPNHNENVQITWLEITVKQQNLPDDKQENKTLCYSFSLFSYIWSATNITMMLYHNVFYLSFFYIGPYAFIYRIYIIYRKYVPNYIY